MVKQMQVELDKIRESHTVQLDSLRQEHFLDRQGLLQQIAAFTEENTILKNNEGLLGEKDQEKNTEIENMRVLHEQKSTELQKSFEEKLLMISEQHNVESNEMEKSHECTVSAHKEELLQVGELNRELLERMQNESKLRQIDTVKQVQTHMTGQIIKSLEQVC